VGRIIRDLGLDGAAFSFVGPFAGVGSEASLVERAWDLDDVAGHYQAFIDAFEDESPEPGEEMLHAQVRLVHEWRRFPFLDPQLPDGLLPPQWIGRRAHSVFAARHAAWERPARACWSALAEE
jgi:phenylacetic acid degradation operon negative regulatory protein